MCKVPFADDVKGGQMMSVPGCYHDRDNCVHLSTFPRQPCNECEFMGVSFVFHTCKRSYTSECRCMSNISYYTPNR